MARFNETEADYLCSAAFAAMGAARLMFAKVYANLKDVLDEEAMLRKDYRAIKKANPMKARQLRDEMAKKYFTDDQRARYKMLCTHLDLLAKDFEWVESFAMLEHLQVKLTPKEFVDIFDSYLSTSNDLARLIFLWSDYCDQNPSNGVLFAESFLKQHTPKQKAGHLANEFKPTV